jgi:hypothetical protein
MFHKIKNSQTNSGARYEIGWLGSNYCWKRLKQASLA